MTWCGEELSVPALGDVLVPREELGPQPRAESPWRGPCRQQARLPPTALEDGGWAEALLTGNRAEPAKSLSRPCPEALELGIPPVPVRPGHCGRSLPWVQVRDAGRQTQWTPWARSVDHLQAWYGEQALIQACVLQLSGCVLNPQEPPVLPVGAVLCHGRQLFPYPCPWLCTETSPQALGLAMYGWLAACPALHPSVSSAWACAPHAYAAGPRRPQAPCCLPASTAQCPWGQPPWQSPHGVLRSCHILCLA